MANKHKEKNNRELRRVRRTRARNYGTAKRPRLAVSRSLDHISCQLIDDDSGKTLAAAGDKGLKGSKTEKAAAVGRKIAESAAKKKISAVVFDRRGKKYHGRVKALAEAAREAGLRF